MIRGIKKHQCVDHYIAELCEQLWEAFEEAVSLEPGDLVWAKANPYRGRRKVKDWWEEELYKGDCQVAEGVPSYLVKNQWTGCSWVLHQNWLFLITPTEGTPSLYDGVH